MRWGILSPGGRVDPTCAVPAPADGGRNPAYPVSAAGLGPTNKDAQCGPHIEALTK